jgi:hypothetical protein
MCGFLRKYVNYNFFFIIKFFFFASKSFLAQKPSTDAVQRTTTAITMLSSGIKDNVM